MTDATLRYVIGLDLGQTQDYTALAVAEVRQVGTGTMVPKGERIIERGDHIAFEPILVEQTERHLHVRHLERFPLNTPYPAIVAAVAALVTRLGGSSRPLLAVDQTGVGRAVVDMFRLARLGSSLWPITITSGGKAGRDEQGDWHVPKRDLVGVLQVFMQNDRLKVARDLPHASTFAQEMQQFRMKISEAANLSFEAWRENDHDDIVLAVALACWVGQRGDGAIGLL